MFRRWMRWPPARLVRTPAWLAALIYRLGDVAGWLGWRPPIRSTAQHEMVRGAVGDPARLTELTGIKPHHVVGWSQDRTQHFIGADDHPVFIDLQHSLETVHSEERL